MFFTLWIFIFVSISLTFLGFEWGGAFFEGLTSCLEEQIKTYNWLNRNCYDKTIKTTISFYICLFFITTKPKRIPKTNAKFNNFFQTCSSQLQLQPHLNINNQPQINWKKKLKLQTKKKPTNNLPPTITEHRSLATKTNHSTGIELKNCDEIKSNYAHANALLPHPNHRTTDTSNNRPTEPSYLQTTKPPIHRTTNPTNHHLRPSFTSDYNRNFHVKRRRNLRAVVANRNR